MRDISEGDRLLEKILGWAKDAKVEPTPAVSSPGWASARPGATARAIRGWERRYGFTLPSNLRTWLAISDGLHAGGGPLVHPLAAIGPMVPFAKMPEPVVQPESWFELGNPGRETICIDLAYRWPDGDCPIFLSGDDESGTHPRVIAPSFASWFLEVIKAEGREYWFDPGFNTMGDPWSAHRQHAPMPPLPARLKRFAPRALPLMRTGADDRSIAAMLGVTRGDVEALFRHLQHVPST